MDPDRKGPVEFRPTHQPHSLQASIPPFLRLGWSDARPCPHPFSLLPLLWPPALSCCPRSIRCLRNIIHWNLISAFILRNATWFVVQLTVSPEVHQSNVVCPS